MTRTNKKNTPSTPSTGSDTRSINNLDKKHYVELCKRLPDVAHFAINLSKYDSLFRKHGLDKRLPYVVKSVTEIKDAEKDGVIRIVPYTNKKVNKYLHHQSIRLNAARGNPLLFWTIAIALVKRSDAFIVSTLNKSHPQWHRKSRLTQLCQAIQEFKAIRFTVRTIDFKRVWIPKDPTNLLKGERPLGVPNDAWRIFNAMLAQILKIWVAPFYPKEQHGFFPHRGTLTAWRSVIKLAFPAKYITEFDLEGYFNNIDIRYISYVLGDLNTPLPIVNYIQDLNLSTPMTDLSSIDLIERELRINAQKKDNLVRGELYNEWLRAIRDNVWQYLHDKALHKVAMLKPFQKWNGIPQGAAMSPILSSLVSADCLFDHIPGLIMYADDGIIYSDTPIKLGYTQKMLNGGVKWNDLKCRVIKENGVWKNELKFLGLLYDPWKDKIKSKTKSGTELTFTKSDLVSAVAATEKDNKQYVKGLPRNWQDFFQSRILGYIQARLYAGKWDLNNLEQDFSYRYKPGSWAQYCPRKPTPGMLLPNVFNSSSIANGWMLDRLKRIGKPPTPRPVPIESIY